MLSVVLLAEPLEPSVKVVSRLPLDGKWCLVHSSGEQHYGVQVPAFVHRQCDLRQVT